MANDDGQALSSVQHISEPCSIIMASVTGVLLVCMLIKTCVARKYKGIMILFLLFLLIRLITYGLRTHLGYNEMRDETIDGNEQIAAGVLMVAAYLFLIEAVLDLTSYWYLDLRDVHLSYNATLVLYLSLYGILTAISVVGVIGQVKEIGSFDPDEIQLGKQLTASSGILFMVVVGFMMIFTILIAIIGPAPMRSQFTAEGVPCKPGVKARVFGSTIFLLFLQACLMVEAIYRLWSATDSTGFIRENAAIAVLVFLPETCAMIAAILVNFQEPIRPTIICCSERKERDLETESISTASHTSKGTRY